VSTQHIVVQNGVAEWSYTSGKAYAHPFDEVEVDVAFCGPETGQGPGSSAAERRVPAYWAGEGRWGVRFSAHQPGAYHYRTVCSDTDNPDLHGQIGTVEVTPYRGAQELQRHGRLLRAANNRQLTHVDGTPFFWLGDTWWMGLCARLTWPEGFRELAADRAAKGFTVVQIVAGLYPDMDAFDPRGANEAGYPWSPDWSCINPAYFDQADLRIAHLVRSGIVPCVVGSWGYYMDRAGEAVLKRHWRNLVARYAAYPVIWCVAGEALMSYYGAEDGPGEQSPEERARHLEMLRGRWSALAEHIRSLDPYGNPLTIHPTQYGHEQVSDPALLDVDMLQTGHSGYPTLTSTVDMVEKALTHEPRRPVLIGEANYEGILESSREEMQRFLFWSTMLSGAAGMTYGANGIWQVNSLALPYGPSPHGTAWGGPPWEDAYRLPGSAQIALGKRLLERYAWWQFEPHPEWIEPHQEPGRRMAPYAAGIPGQVRVIYYPAEASWRAWGGSMFVTQLEEHVPYQAYYFDPKTGSETPLGTAHGGAAGSWRVPKPPVFQDWALVLEA
jgi:hypothetical protein